VWLDQSLSSLSRKSLCYFSSRLTPSAQSAGRKHKEISVYAFVKMRFYWLIASAPFVCEHLHVAKYVMQEERKLATKNVCTWMKTRILHLCGQTSFWGGCMRSTTFTFVFLECAGAETQFCVMRCTCTGKIHLKSIGKRDSLSTGPMHIETKNAQKYFGSKRALHSLPSSLTKQETST
jgi:hypothetical protein